MDYLNFNLWINSINNIDEILQFIKDQKLSIYPKNESIFRCFNYFDLNETKVVILGQDPYHGPNQATGLCFGVNNNCKPIPPSLKNIAKELKSDLNIDLSDWTLENWAKQGVLLLNSALTVTQGKPGSHMKIWSNFTKSIIDFLNKQEKSIIFVAWGAFAHNKLQNIDKKHKLIVSSHPSPLSVYKKYKNFPPFSGSKPFSKINEILKEENKHINW
jgi:uracil-DNA glycosylase